MKKNKPKAPEQIAQRNLTRNLSNKGSSANIWKKCGLSVVNHSVDGVEIGVGGEFACAKHGIVVHRAEERPQTPSKSFSKDEIIVIEKYKSGEITKEEANVELDKIFKATIKLNKAKGKKRWK